MPRITESVIGSTLGLNLVFVVVLDLRVEPPTAFFVRPLLPDMVFSVANARPSNDFDRHLATSICSIGSYPLRRQMQSLRVFCVEFKR